ncbi:hypothetical protein BCV70DRAFT_208301 [Testicularia cyperi]|uniref:Cation/H+ exchanger transmembrane domain-containing protein n=1 Tax=Testicularia cyperi TaxID=1882483 RepID=A0A317XHJ6_9BASI|nr:hypothetical protein BCV70DRAFT_208301 [Testicularia cyperi]
MGADPLLFVVLLGGFFLSAFLGNSAKTGCCNRKTPTLTCWPPPSFFVLGFLPSNTYRRGGTRSGFWHAAADAMHDNLVTLDPWHSWTGCNVAEMAIELETTSLNLICTAFGLFFVAYGTFSYLIKERLFLGEAPIAVAIGVALGPYGLGDIFNWASKEVDVDEISLGLCRVVIGIQLTLVGVQLPYKYPWVELRSLTMLLIPVMTVMWISTMLCIWAVIPGIPILAGLVLATSATPTDPVLSNAIVKGAFADQYISPRIRNLISGESGANDGFGYPFLFLARMLLRSDMSTFQALTNWILETCLYTVGGAILYGALIGYLCRKLLEFSTDRNLIDKESFLLFGAAMGVFIVGSGGVFQIDDLLAAFVAGNALSWTDFYREQCEESEVDNSLDLVLNLVFFSFLGATIPWDSFNDPENGITPPRLMLMCVLVLLFRRLPAMLAFYRFVPTLHDVSEAAFVGYFAPIGAGALFYLGVILDEFKPDDPDPVSQRIRVLVKPITYSLILASILGHSLAIPLVKLAFTCLDIKSIKLQGESEKGEGSEVDSISERGSVSDRDVEGQVLAYEEGEHVVPDSHRHSGTSASSRQADSYRHTTVHRTDEHTRRHQHRHGTSDTEESDHEVSGAYHRDGTWDNRASWRLSSGHKLGPHHRLRRNHETGELELDPRVYTIEHGAPSHLRPRPRRSRSHGPGAMHESRRRARTSQAEDEQGLLEDGRRISVANTFGYGSFSEHQRDSGGSGNEARNR